MLPLLTFTDSPAQPPPIGSSGRHTGLAHGESASAMPGEKVLIVEDETVVALSIHMRLAAANYAVVGIADSAEGALTLAGNTDPDLVLMDIQLKGRLNGIETAQKIREQYDIPIVYLTAHTDPATIQQAKTTEPYGYILKPFETIELCTAIEFALYKHHADQKIRAAESHLHRLNDELEERVRARTAELEATNQRLQQEIAQRQQAELAVKRSLAQQQELNDLKSRFITTASHEFRTPLSIILTSAELLECLGTDCPPDKQHRYVQKIRDAVQGMTAILSDMMMLGKAEAGILEFQPTVIDLAAFCQELVADLQLATNWQPPIQLTLAENCGAVLLDGNLLLWMLMNLLSNAIKYSPAGGEIRLTVACERHRWADGESPPTEPPPIAQNHVIFQVQDQGMGIPPADVPRLFESFHRARNVDTIGGTGLGLAIVHQCVELHGGTIEIKSEISQGTHVTITLPIGD
jgi:signal transduction histidine kinase